VKHSSPVSKPRNGKGRPRRHLSIVDNNAIEANGSKSSLDDHSGDAVFYTTSQQEVQQTFEEGNVVAKANKTKDEKQMRPKINGNQCKPKPNYPANSYEKSTTLVASSTSHRVLEADVSISRIPQIKLDDLFYEETLPTDVVNIEVDDGMYEYSKEVVKYLMMLESMNPIPPEFLEDGSITANMRSILVDWIIQVQHHMKLCQETLYLAVGILDMVLHRRDVDTDKLQLVGITALLVASKLEEYYAVDIKKLLHLTENSYTRLQVTHMERTLLGVLDFQVYLPSPQVYLLRFTRAALRGDDAIFLKTCQYLLDSHLPHPSHPCSPPSCLAAAAVACSCLLYQVSANPGTTPAPSSIWTPTLVHYTTYALTDIIQTCEEMMSQVLDATLGTTKLTGSKTKYTSASQHQRLVLSKHLAAEVLEESGLVLTHWTQ